MDSTNKDLSHSLNKPNNNRLTLCQDRICLECGNDHSFRDNIKDAITFIDLLPEIFKENRNGGISNTKLQEFVN